MKTIAAISSPIGAGGIGIVRVSGDEALAVADAIFSFNGGKNDWTPLRMNFGTFNAGDFCDKGYAVFFPAGKSYTGDDTVEFYLHGGVRIMQGALDAALRQGASLAEKGEFTKRAFLSGRISLADAEGVIDMINAQSAAALRAAYRQMEGGLSTAIYRFADSLADVLTGLSAVLDYPDEMADEVLPPLKDRLVAIKRDVDALLATAGTGKMIKHGINVALVGRPNAGKSSLFNALLKENRAIVTDIAGTTRDTIEASFECDGALINLTDTAGIRESADAIEAEGVDRAKAAARGADIILRVIDREPPDELDFGDALVFDVYTKCDLNGFCIPRKMYTFAVSAKTGEGIDSLAKAIAAKAMSGLVQNEDIITNERHKSALYNASLHLKSAIESIDGPIDLTASDVSAAYDAFGEITGAKATADVVDAIFSRFCVGK